MQTVSQYIIERGATSVILHVFIEDSSATTGAGLTGLTNASSGLVITAMRPGEASATVYTVAASNVETISTIGTYAAPTASKIRFKEIDSTNRPGWYEIQAADALFNTTSSRRGLIIEIHGATNQRPATIQVQLTGANLNDDVRAGLTSLPNAAAAASGGLFTRGTGAGQINQDANGRIDVNVAAISADSTAADNAESFFDGTGYAGTNNVIPTVTTVSNQTIRSNTAQAGAAQTITLDASASAVDNVYNFNRIVLTGGTGSGQTRRIVSYVGSTKIATVDRPWTTTPDNTSTFAIHGDVQSRTSSILRTATAQTATASGITLDASASAVDDFYTRCQVLITSGTGAGQVRRISGYVGSTKVASLSEAWETTPDNTSVFEVIGDTDSKINDTLTVDLSAAAVDAIWDENIVSAHGTADTAGYLLSILTGRTAGTFNTTVVDTSVFGQIVDDGTATYARSTDSLQAQRDNTSGPALAASVNDGSPTAAAFIGSSGLSSADDKYNGSFLGFTSGTNQGIYRKIVDYVGSTKTFTFDQAFPAAPANADTFEITGWGGTA